jgi:hypothetical protein
LGLFWVEGMSGVRGMVEGKIITETIENMINTIEIQITDAKPNTHALGLIQVHIVYNYTLNQTNLNVFIFNIILYNPYFTVGVFYL